MSEPPTDSKGLTALSPPITRNNNPLLFYSSSENLNAISPPITALSPPPENNALFANVASSDFLQFQLTRSYAEQLQLAVAKTGKLCAIDANKRLVNGIEVIWIEHEYGFIGGSLGCAEGEKICRGIEKAIELNLPVVICVRSGGARMQEGTLALMQMAKVSVAIQKLKDSHLPYISVCCDPTFGGTTASYVLQADFKIAYKNARIGFAGEQVILNTVYKMEQSSYDEACPQGFQTATFVKDHGQIDATVNSNEELEILIGKLLYILAKARNFKVDDCVQQVSQKPSDYVPDFTRARRSDRIQCQDVIQRVFANFVPLEGDGRVGKDLCIIGGLATLEVKSEHLASNGSSKTYMKELPVMVIGTQKGHDAESMEKANYGMPSPHGYRTAGRLMELAEHFGIPIVTLVDTPGAYPSFTSEVEGQPEAIASNLLLMSRLKVPIVTVFVGEGGSGGAIGIAVADRIAMLSDGYYSVITPEGAASILCRYRSDAEKTKKFPDDCKRVANIQRIFATDLLELGVIDEIIWEKPNETYDTCGELYENIKRFVLHSLSDLSKPTGSVLVQSRHDKFRKMGKVSILSTDEIVRSLSSGLSIAPIHSVTSVTSALKTDTSSALSDEQKAFKVQIGQMLKFLSNVIVNGTHSVMSTVLPSDLGIIKPIVPLKKIDPSVETAKTILDRDGPDAVVKWLQKQERVLITDTSMRDAHQSLLATRVRTTDLLSIADEAAVVLGNAFSFECWGGATFDVAIRFLNECPFERLRLIRKHVPNVCLQMLIRGANAVGYKSYPDNVIVRFIELAAENGIDVFRIFDCFNSIDQMKLCITTVRRVGKLAEAAICFTGDFLKESEKIYTLDYYSDMAKQLTEAGAHIIAIKDMAGLFKPLMAKPFMEAMRKATDLPIHFHTHNTSHAALLSCVAMAQHGCQIIDLASAAIADTTSQPSLNAFLAAMEGDKCAAAIDWMELERLDMQWTNIRSLYFPHESGLKSGTARVYDHQIPGGQYTNLIAQCKSLGLWSRWDDVLNMYRDVNDLLGNIIKVTPSSKVVGDFALFLINKGMSIKDVLEKGDEIDFPDSVVDLYQGMIGYPHHGLNPALSHSVLKGKTPLSGRPGASLSPADFEDERKKLQKMLNREPKEDEIITSVLYPKQFEDFVKFRQENGDDMVSYLPTFTFFYGMKVGGNVDFDYKGQNVRIHLHRVYPLTQDNMRTLVFHVGEFVIETKVKEKKGETTQVHGPIANPSDPTQIPSPLPGIVDKVYVKTGDVVAKDTLLANVAAMKMEVSVIAPHAGRVSQVCVSVGSKVDNKSLLMRIV